MRTFVMLYVNHYKTAIICADHRTFSTLARVSSTWWQTLVGWPQSDTRLWLKHQIVKQVGGQLLPMQTLSVGVGRMFGAVCLFVCPQHNSETNE